MSGFQPEWLKLRAAADARARDKTLLKRLSERFAGRDTIKVVDLGAGLGSNLRATAPALPAHQRWTLIDHDPVLLAGACEAIAAWADKAQATADGVEAMKENRHIHVTLKRADLAADPAAWGENADLITAAALFDLVSAQWIDRFVAALKRARLPLYAALTHDGVTEWNPPHPADRAMHAAFEHHFARDKGFGPSAGGKASGLLVERLKAAGYEVERAASPWRLGAADAALIVATAEGWAAAVRETAEVPATTITEWLAARKTRSIACIVGHEDLIAFPAG